MGFWDKAGDVFLKQRAAVAQNKDALDRMWLHGHNQGQQLYMQHLARGYGIDPATQPFLKPYGVEPDMNVTNNLAPSQPQQQQASSALPWVAGLMLGMTGLGIGGGALYALKDKIGASPVVTAPGKPQEFDIKIKQIDGNLKVEGIDK